MSWLQSGHHVVNVFHPSAAAGIGAWCKMKDVAHHPVPQGSSHWPLQSLTYSAPGRPLRVFSKLALGSFLKEPPFWGAPFILLRTAQLTETPSNSCVLLALRPQDVPTKCVEGAQRRYSPLTASHMLPENLIPGSSPSTTLLFSTFNSLLKKHNYQQTCFIER